MSRITVDRYRSGCIGIGGDTQTDIRRYCKATSEYSPIRSIGLTLVKLNSIGGAIILFAAASVYGQISVCFSLEIFVILQRCLIKNSSH